MSRTFHRDAVAADAFVHLVADQLIADLRADTLDPSLVHVADDGCDRLEIGVKPLDGHHPSEWLVGFTAPSDWHALGMATRGWAYRLTDRGSPTRHRARVLVVTLVSRTGELAQRTHVQDDAELATALGDAPDDTVGEQIDLLRLAFGLPTPPPPCGTDVFWTIEWLSALLDTEAGDLGDWTDVADRHPAMSLARPQHDPSGAGEPAFAGVEWTAVVHAFTRVFSWRRLRALVGDDRLPVPELIPSDAMWFDDGAFARFLLSRCPPLGMLRDHAGRHLPTPLSRRLADTLDELGIPESSWPETGDEAGR